MEDQGIAQFIGRIEDLGCRPNLEHPETSMDANEATMTLHVLEIREPVGLSPTAISFFAFACGATVANIYYAQSLVGPIYIYGLSVEARGRLNEGYMTVVFLCGAIGSAVGSLTYAYGGWWLTALLGAGLGCVILLVFATEHQEAAETALLR